jgi:glutamate dehydrogenase (NADP+)
MKNVEEYIKDIQQKNQNETEYIQAVQEFLTSVYPYIRVNKKYLDQRIIERLVEPERIIIFRVPWVNDKGEVEINRGYRVQFNSALGPYKGGLRFHPSVNLSILKFLGFEQVFKNSLTGLLMGGGKGGSDFDPKGKSDNEVMKFSQSFMTELFRHIGSNTDVPAGDIGVGAREIGYLFGQYKRLSNEFSGVLTGKSINWGGSLIRPEATGYGLLYFVNEMLNQVKIQIQDKKIAISGSGNVAQFGAEKAIQMGAIVQTMSDSDGFVYVKRGLTKEELEFIKELKNIKRGRIEEFATEFGHQYFQNEKPWKYTSYDIALPCATQNEIEIDDAVALVKNGVMAVGEGANMPSSIDSMKYFVQHKVLFAPAKAANAGGVAVSGLEMSQNSMRLSWSAQEVDTKLKEIMKNIHEKTLIYGSSKEGINYVNGANIAGFVKVADAMIDQGVV